MIIMGFWSSFFGFAAANAVNEIKKEERQNKKWNDLFYELSDYEDSFNNFLSTIGCNDFYIADVEAVNDGNILPEKMKMDTYRRKINEYIALGGKGKYIYNIDNIDNDIAVIKYLKKKGCLHRLEEFAGIDLILVQSSLENELGNEKDDKILLNTCENESNSSISLNDTANEVENASDIIPSKQIKYPGLDRQVEWFGGKLENVTNNEHYKKFIEFLDTTALNDYQKKVLQIQYRFLITDAIRGLHKGKIINYLINNYPEVVTAFDLINENKVYHKFIWTFEKENEVLVEKCMSILEYQYKKYSIKYDNEDILIYIINIPVDVEWESDLNKLQNKNFDLAREYGYKLFDELNKRMIKHGMCWYTYGNPEINLLKSGKLFPVRVLFINTNNDSWAKEGYRKDLDHAFRSSWEANIARILNYKQIRWAYEPRFINLESPDYVKKSHPHLKGQTNYLPDFELEDGTIIEVKGFWDSRSKINVSQFMEQYPAIKYIVIDSDIYRNLVIQYKDIIPNWENEQVISTNDKVQVVGITFPQRKKFVDAIQSGDVLDIVREPENEYDSRAIRVNDKDGNQLGYLARDCNCIYAPKMDMGFKYEISVVSKESKVLQCKIKLVNTDEIILPDLFV